MHGRRARWVDILQEYDIIVQHRPGTQQVVEDALSRVFTQREAAAALNSISVAVVDHTELVQQIAEKGQQDDWYKRMLDQAATPNGEYATADGHLLYQRDGPHVRLCVPDDNALKQRLLRMYHDAPISGHHGVAKTLAELKEHFYWPKMAADVKDYCSTCPSCAKHKYSTQAPHGLLQPLAVPTEPFESISLDFIMGLPTSSSGHDAILTVVDRFSKALFLFPVNTTITAAETAQLLFSTLFKTFGLPTSVVSDRDPRFLSAYWQQLYKLYGVQLKMSSAYHPQTDGQTEVANRIVATILRHYVAPDHSDWHLWLPIVEQAYNSSVHNGLKEPPIAVLLNRRPNQPLAMLHKAAIADSTAAFAAYEREQRLQQIRAVLEHARDAT